MTPNEPIPAAEHEKYMRRCIVLAKLARERGNTAVGSIVVLGGEIIGEGIEELPSGLNITGHAEVIACQSAIEQTGDRKLAGARLYSTAEPCFMCSYVIRQCEIEMVVYGSDCPIIGGATSNHAILTDPKLAVWKAAPRVVAGILLDECEKI